MARSVQVISQRSLNNILKDHKEVQAALVLHARKAEVRANVLLASHRKTGNAKIEGSSGKIDHYVSLVDPAAMSIEFGHWSDRAGRWVEGLHVITRAALGL